MKRKNRFRKTFEYLCTRRRIISFIVAVLSAATAVGYIVYSGVCAFNIDKVKETMKGLWGFQFVASVGFYTLFSVLGIILFSVLGLYRALMCYFYYKIYKCDVAFYKERRNDIFLFSFFSFVMTGVYFFLYYKEGAEMPYVGKGGSLAAAIIYLLLGWLPLIEKIICDVTVRVMKKKRAVKVPKRGDIEEELENDADLSALSAFGQTNGVNGDKKPTADKNAEVNLKNAAKKAEDEPAAEKISAAKDISDAEDIFDATEEERITKSYGKAAGRLARRMKEMEEEDEDDGEDEDE